MDKAKAIFKENMVAIILLVVIAATAIVFLIIDTVENSEKYKDPFIGTDEIEFENRVYEENEYRIIEVSDADLAVRYYKYIIKYLVDDPEVIYNMLDSSQKGEFANVKAFERYVDKLLTSKSRANNVVKYGIEKITNSENMIVLVDSEDISYTIYERGIWNLTIKINGKVNPDNL